MRRWGSVWAVGWVLLGLLALSTGLLMLGSRERVSKPSALSFAPSGTHALAELLRSEGFEVVIDRASKPKLRESDLVLGFIVPDRRGVFDEPVKPRESPTHRTLNRHLEEGGRALLCAVPVSFREASKRANAAPKKVTLSGPKGAFGTYEISNGDVPALSEYDVALDVASRAYDVALDENEIPVLRFFNHGKGILALVSDGLGGTNRYLDAHQNASYFLKLATMLSPEKGRIVIVDALNASPVDPGLIATIGPWALAAWWQIILLFVVIAFTLGRRFGLPESPRYHQRGGRELADAYADVMNRARMPHIALGKAVQEADREVRKRFSISADLPPGRRNEMLPDALASALTQAEIASRSPLPDPAALQLLRKLEDEMAGLKGETIRRRRKKR